MIDASSLRWKIYEDSRKGKNFFMGVSWFAHKKA